jgi:predicted secreted protein
MLARLQESRMPNLSLLVAAAPRLAVRAALAALVLAAPAAAEVIEVRPELSFQGSAPLREAVEAHVGDTIRVALPAQAGSGYAWSETVAGDVLVPGRRESRPADRPGGPQPEIRTYRATAVGGARIDFAYRRPWETSRPPARQVVLSVTVTERPEPELLAPPGQP